MNFQTAENEDLFIDEINKLFKKLLIKGSRLFIPAGNTPVLLYKNWELEQPEFLKEVTFVQIDEVLNGKKPFKAFFKKHLPSYYKNIEWIGNNPKKADVALLGLGLNGHVGFHEPGIPDDFKFGEVELSEQTCLSLGENLPLKGLTYGLGTFMQCEAVVLIVRGAKKQDVLNKVVENDKNLPASKLNDHNRFYIVNYI
jgi:6-phosphogluconolactonase/glucosamine-6-phosphate isomerase/deaminase